jgi:hypothetical protein
MDPEILQRTWFSNLGQDQEKNDRAKATADAVEEGQAEALHVVTLSGLLHGQSFDGLT